MLSDAVRVSSRRCAPGLRVPLETRSQSTKRRTKNMTHNPPATVEFTSLKEMTSELIVWYSYCLFVQIIEERLFLVGLVPS